MRTARRIAGINKMINGPSHFETAPLSEFLHKLGISPYEKAIAVSAVFLLIHVKDTDDSDLFTGFRVVARVRVAVAQFKLQPLSTARSGIRNNTGEIDLPGRSKLSKWPFIVGNYLIFPKVVASGASSSSAT